MKYIFKSTFAKDIEDYITLRTSLGYEGVNYARRLHSFDDFCTNRFPGAETLTQKISEEWCTLKPGEIEKTLQLRAGILRGFAKYLNSIGKHAYILPDGFAAKKSFFLPYLYTSVEIENFFHGADRLPLHPLSPYREYIVPVLFRMLYCCGLRPQEGRLLKRQDVGLDAGTLYIAESKGNKDRIVAMSGDMAGLCREYDYAMQVLLPNREFFFQNLNGEPFTAVWIQNQFFKCWRSVGVSFDKTRKPRVYDWRHNHATNVIAKWLDEGKNIAALLPYLSIYMGHTSLEYTAHYIYLVPERLRSSNLTEWDCCQEVPVYED